MDIEHVVLVDENDNSLGTMEKQQAHIEGVLHRAFSIFLLRQNAGEIEILLQQRQAHKYHCPNLWTNTACSHPRHLEKIVTAGERRLFEEMQIKCTLRRLGSFIYRAELGNGLIEHEFDYVLVGSYADDKINFNQAEVQAVQWISIDKLESWLKHMPGDFTPWFKLALAKLQQNWDTTLELCNIV